MLMNMQQIAFQCLSAIKRFELALPDESVIYTDKAYTDYEHEDLLKESKST